MRADFSPSTLKLTETWYFFGEHENECCVREFIARILTSRPIFLYVRAVTLVDSRGADLCALFALGAQLTETRKLGPMPVIRKSINHPIVIMRNCLRATAVIWVFPFKNCYFLIRLDAIFLIYAKKTLRNGNDLVFHCELDQFEQVTSVHLKTFWHH